MLTLLHLLSAVSMLVWGTHIVRTGVMRVFGARLRTVLSRSDERSASGNSTLLRFGGFFADQTYLQVTRLMQRIHYLHQRLVIDGFVRSEEDGGVFLAFG